MVIMIRIIVSFSSGFDIAIKSVKDASPSFPINFYA